MRLFKVDNPVFKLEVLFCMDCNYESMREYMNRRFRLQIPECDDHQQILGTSFTFGKPPWRVVWVRYARHTAVIVHEIVHLVTRICQDRGVPVVSHHPNGESGDETLAYLIEFLFAGSHQTT